uniref:Uncharacterized protein n=1 Tax=Candidatus Kentrum sp. LFY TaxID=2126342 RepID=A0A450U6G5_9GAMM|nr:MAG: hypothetical protein BECKLFY1418A_GA0070994_100148 [Candidatus Kentron sp. LFY]
MVHQILETGYILTAAELSGKSENHIFSIPGVKKVRNGLFHHPAKRFPPLNGHCAASPPPPIARKRR